MEQHRYLVLGQLYIDLKIARPRADRGLNADQGVFRVMPWIAPMPDELRFPMGSINPVVACIAGVAVAAVSGYFAIGLLDRFTRAPRLNGFAFYCLCMGLAMVILGTVGVDGFFYATTMQHP